MGALFIVIHGSTLLRYVRREASCSCVLCLSSTNECLSALSQTVEELLLFLPKTFLKRTAPGQRQSVEHEVYVVHCFVRRDGLAAAVITDSEYPARVAFTLLNNLLEDFTAEYGDSWRKVTDPGTLQFHKAEEYLQKYQDPDEADKLTRIQRDLDESMFIMHKTIGSMLEKGKKLDDLVRESNELSIQAQMFYKEARKNNSCCRIA